MSRCHKVTKEPQISNSQGTEVLGSSEVQHVCRCSSPTPMRSLQRCEAAAHHCQSSQSFTLRWSHIFIGRYSCYYYHHFVYLTGELFSSSSLCSCNEPWAFRYWNMGTHKSIMRVKLVSAAISISCFDNKTWKCFWHEQSNLGRGREMGNKREGNNDDDEMQRTKRENRMKGIYLLSLHVWPPAFSTAPLSTHLCLGWIYPQCLVL